MKPPASNFHLWSVVSSLSCSHFTASSRLPAQLTRYAADTLRCAALCCAMLCYAVLSYAVLCHAVPCRAVL